ncbi:YidB family protein [Methylobacterium oxalidis]|uniref:DUF937 domain-containing protein n=2 Tax=Methylobacterium oxalidis TaxID=944322 RepID=A0A512IXS2_9HYPH|nr:YidB family protein [Methylobacterium oxalidis]GEP02399.1 hypothetical protein MOX02_04370 [Methylobacterium oxalidis]GLS67778.1 hypothetical protein GCM10007888_61630 [Methylobacterium oxalidis]
MGLLDSVIGGVLGQVLGGGRGGHSGQDSSAGMSPLVKALLMLLMAKGASGGFGDIFGRGGPRHEPDYEPGPEDDRSGGAGPYGRDDRDPSGDIGGFNQGGYDPSGARRDGPPREGDFSDLAGMLDGPGDSGPGPSQGYGRDPGAGPYAHLDREPDDAFGHGGPGGPDLGGLDGLIDRFQRGGLGDVIGSWIGHGQNRPVQPNQLADALGPDTLDTLERQTGMDRSALLSQLAQVLPEVINGLTPQGRVPSGEERRGW